MANLKQTIPTNQAIAFVLWACLVVFPLLAYRESTDVFGTPALVHLAALTGFGGLVGTAVIARRGNRLLALLPGAVGGVGVALLWHYLLFTNPIEFIGQGKRALLVSIFVGASPGLALYVAAAALRGKRDMGPE